jgi:hypothetical protein
MRVALLRVSLNWRQLRILTNHSFVGGPERVKYEVLIARDVRNGFFNFGSVFFTNSEGSVWNH